MKIWQLDPFGLTPYYDRALCSGLAAYSHDVCLFTSPSPYETAPLAADGYRIDERVYGQTPLYPRWLRRGRRVGGYLFAHRRLLAQLDAAPPDIVHMQWCRLPAADAWLVRQLQQRGLPVVYTLHDVEPLFALPFAHGLQHIRALVDRVVVHAHENRQRLLQRQPALAGKTRVVAHPALRWPEPAAASRFRARQQLGLPPDAPILLFFGSDRPYKGLDLLIEAVSCARKRCPDIWLLIAGQVDRRRVAAIQQALERQIIIQPQYVPADQVWLYHRGADVAVFPYRRVSQSGGVITAMGCGLPVIAAAVGGLPETVTGNGWLVPPGNSTSLAQAICAAFADRDQLPALGRRSLALIREHHQPACVAQQTLALYQEVLSS